MLRSVASAGPLSIASAVPLSIASYEALKAPAAALLGECVSPMWLMGRVVLGYLIRGSTLYMCTP